LPAKFGKELRGAPPLVDRSSGTRPDLPRP